MKGSPIKFYRIYFVAGFLVLLFAALEIRLFHIQISNHDYYKQISQNQAEKDIQLPASKGIIFDRNNKTLATNLIYYDLGVDLNLVRNKDSLAHNLSLVSDRSARYFRNKLETESRFTFLQRKIAKEAWVFDKINSRSLVKIKSFRRYYPYGRYASQLIGFTDIDDRGASGIELQFEEYLKGKDGFTTLHYDARRRPAYSPEHPLVAPESGADIVLTIDKNYQTIVEDALTAGVSKYKAKSGMALLMRPQTGEILAIASSPAFNPNDPASSSAENRRNRVITDVFEPGSTFKLFSAAALLQEGIKQPEEIVFCYNGSYDHHGHTINDTKKYGWLTFRKVFENSSNIGMVKMSDELDANVLFRYLKNFGFGSVTGMGLAGENAGMLERPESYSKISKGVISFGQEVGVTALQIVNAYCAVVNGGYLMRPYVIKEIIGEGGTRLLENKPVRIRQAISRSAAEILREFMVGVVNNGTGSKAAIKNLEIGGKTGTAQKYDPELGRYKPGAYYASFIGYASGDNPKFVLGVFMDEPRYVHYGGDACAPVFREIIRGLVNLEPTDITEPVDLVVNDENPEDVPDLTGLNIKSALELLESNRIDYDLEGEGSYIVNQQVDDDELILTLSDEYLRDTKVPDLRGLTIREALKKVDFSKFVVKINGTGVVASQSLRPGQKITRQAILVLNCRES